MHVAGGSAATVVRNGVRNSAARLPRVGRPSRHEPASASVVLEGRCRHHGPRPSSSEENSSSDVGSTPSSADHAVQAGLFASHTHYQIVGGRIQSSPSLSSSPQNPRAWCSSAATPMEPASSSGGASAPPVPPPHLGPDILAQVVAATFSPDFDEEASVAYEEEEVGQHRRSLRLCSRTLRDLVDAATTWVWFMVSRCCLADRALSSPERERKGWTAYCLGRDVRVGRDRDVVVQARALADPPPPPSRRPHVTPCLVSPRLCVALFHVH